MAHEIVRANHQNRQRIATQLGRASACAAQLRRRALHCYAPLEQGGGGGGGGSGPSREDELKQLISAGRYEEAIQKAVEVYNLDVSAIRGALTFDDSLAEAYVALQDGGVRFGRAAFASPAMLVSTIGHAALYALPPKGSG